MQRPAGGDERAGDLRLPRAEGEHQGPAELMMLAERKASSTEVSAIASITLHILDALRLQLSDEVAARVDIFGEPGADPLEGLGRAAHQQLAIMLPRSIRVSAATGGDSCQSPSKIRHSFSLPFRLRMGGFR